MQLTIETVPIGVPLRIGGPVEDVGDVVPRAPGSRAHWDEASAGSTGHGDEDLLPALDASQKFGGLLTQLAQSDRDHPTSVAQVLLVVALLRAPGQRCLEWVAFRQPAAERRHVCQLSCRRGRTWAPLGRVDGRPHAAVARR